MKLSYLLGNIEHFEKHVYANEHNNELCNLGQ